MTRITVELPDDLAERVNAAATERGLEPSELARKTLAEQFPPRTMLNSIGAGAYGGAETAEPDSTEGASIADLARAVNGGTLKQEIDEAVNGDPELVV